MNQENQHYSQLSDGLVALVLEDHEVYRAVVMRALEGYVNGAKSLGAASVLEAVTILECRKVDVLVADMTLPDGTALDLLAQAGHHVARGMKVILFSNYSSAEMGTLLDRPDVHAVLTKEQGLRELARIVRGFCTASQNQSQSQSNESLAVACVA